MGKEAFDWKGRATLTICMDIISHRLQHAGQILHQANHKLRFGFFLDREGRFLVLVSVTCLAGGIGDTAGVASEEDVPDIE